MGDPNVEYVRLLLDSGASMSVGHKPIVHLAVEGGSPEVIKLLLERGADRNATYCNRTAFDACFTSERHKAAALFFLDLERYSV